MKFIFLLMLLLSLHIIYGIEDNNYDEEDDEKPFDISDMGFGAGEYDPIKFMNVMLAQKQDPNKMLKIFRAILLKGYKTDDSITMFKPVILSALMDSYVPGQKEALRVIAVLAEARIDHIEKDVLRALIQDYMQSKDPTILLKTLKALSAIISQDSEHRNWSFSYKIDDQLVRLAYDDSLPLPIMQEVTEVIKFLCLSGDKIMTEKTKTKLTTMIEHFLLKNSDPKIRFNSVAAYYRLTMPPRKYQYYIINEIAKKYVEFLEQGDDDLKYATLNVIETIVEKEKPADIEMFLANGIMALMPSLLARSNEMVLEKSLVVLARLAGSAPNHTRDVFEDEILSKVIKLMYHKNINVKNSAALVPISIIMHFDEDEIIYLINAKALHGLCHNIKWFEKVDHIVEAIVTVYRVILKDVKSHIKPVYDILDECDGLRILYRLKKRPNKIISEYSEQIIEIFDNLKAEEKLKNVEL